MIALFLGGARSGKSVAAERYAARLSSPVTFVATWCPGDQPDPDMEARVAAHRSRRPADWKTCETADLAATVRAMIGTVLIDSLGTWVASAQGFGVDVGELCAALVDRHGDTVVVSEEVGLGVHPSTALGREFRDALGAVNEAMAAISDRAWLVVAGRTLELDR